MPAFLRALFVAAALMVATVASHTASAAPLNAPVPGNAFTTYQGYEWAWAAPCSAVDPSCGVIDLSFQAGLGWRLPTLAEARAVILPDIAAFVNAFFYAGANASFGGNDFACASAWFSTLHTHCDVNDALIGGIWNLGPNSSFPGNPLQETFVIRDIAPVPVPAAFGMLALGLAALGALRRRRGKAA